MRTYRPFGVLILAMLALLGCSKPSFHMTDISGAMPQLDFRLVRASDGALVTGNTYLYSVVVLYFGYTHCPDVCQVVLSTLASAMTRLDKADHEQVDVVFVTTDPERDTEKVLRNYLDRFDPTFIGLTGPLDSIIDVGKGMAVAVEQGHQLPSGGYDVTHGTSVLAIDGGDEVPILWTQGTSATQFASDVHQLLEE